MQIIPNQEDLFPIKFSILSKVNIPSITSQYGSFIIHASMYICSNCDRTINPRQLPRTSPTRQIFPDNFQTKQFPPMTISPQTTSPPQNFESWVRIVPGETVLGNDRVGIFRVEIIPGLIVHEELSGWGLSGGSCPGTSSNSTLCPVFITVVFTIYIAPPYLIFTRLRIPLRNTFERPLPI